MPDLSRGHKASGGASMHRACLRVIMLLVLGLPLAAMAPKPPEPAVDPTPAAVQAWRNALVQIDAGAAGRPQRRLFGRLRHVEHLFADMPAGAQVPAILYLHDCAGIKMDAVRDVEQLAAIGYAVFAPDSFDSRARKPDCARRDFVAGLNPEAYVQRQAEIAVALTELRKMPWIDQSAIVLYGLGEGALAAANYAGHEFRAVVLTGWACGGGRYDRNVAGLKSPTDVPILALVSRYDPWFDRNGRAGNCGDYMGSYKYAQSIVIENRGLHHVSWMDSRASAAIRRFLQSVMPPRL